MSDLSDVTCIRAVCSFNFRTQARDTDSSVCVAAQRSGVDYNNAFNHYSMLVRIGVEYTEMSSQQSRTVGCHRNVLINLSPNAPN